MATQKAKKSFLKLWGQKPSKPSTRGNDIAFKAGERSFKKSNGSTPDLQRVVMMALKNEIRAKG